MWNKKNLIALISILPILCIYSISNASKDKEADAIQSSKTWLKLVDEGKYSDSWKEAAKYFKDAINEKQWNQQIAAARKPLGKVISRELKSASYKTALPGAPDGEYVVIQYSTSFENKKSSIETITPMLEKDGKWKVSGYYIK